MTKFSALCVFAILISAQTSMAKVIRQYSIGAISCAETNECPQTGAIDLTVDGQQLSFEGFKVDGRHMLHVCSTMGPAVSLKAEGKGIYSFNTKAEAGGCAMKMSISDKAIRILSTDCVCGGNLKWGGADYLRIEDK